MTIKTTTIRKCDACGKEEDESDIELRRRKAYPPDSTEEWRRFSAGYRQSYRGYKQSEFDVCSWACAKQVHAKLAEVTFDRKTAENEAACLEWAIEQAAAKVAELEAKTDEVQRLTERVRTLEQQVRNARPDEVDAIRMRNDELERRVVSLGEELREARSVDRLELARLLRELDTQSFWHWQNRRTNRKRKRSSLVGSFVLLMKSHWRLRCNEEPVRKGGGVSKLIFDDVEAMAAIETLRALGWRPRDVENVMRILNQIPKGCTCDPREDARNRCGDGFIRCNGALGASRGDQ